jgi:hypothetical protein
MHYGRFSFDNTILISAKTNVMQSGDVYKKVA